MRSLSATWNRSGCTAATTTIDFRVITRSGEERWIGHCCQPVYSREGQYLGQRGSNRDITERKRAEEELQESEQRVRWLNEHLLNMVMVLSHDIRGPLVGIASILKLLLRGAYGKLDQSPANTVQDLLSRCARLLGTAEDYLGKASIVVGSMTMDREVLDLRQDIIDAVLDELADDITRHEIVIDNRLGAIPAGSISISANKTWLKAVYRNLFTNAIKYGGKGCTISFGFEQHESHYRLNVYNSGRPIAEEDRETDIHQVWASRAIGRYHSGRCRPWFVPLQGNHPRSRRRDMVRSPAGRVEFRVHHIQGIGA